MFKFATRPDAETRAASAAAKIRHTLAEDGYAMLIGATLLAFGLTLLKAAGLATGGVAGLSLLVSYLVDWPIALIYLAINLPFYILAQQALGWTFTLKTLATNAFLAALLFMMPRWIDLQHLDIGFASVFGGTIAGIGILFLARHKSSIGGTSVLGIWFQERHGISAGKVQMACDCIIVIIGFTIIPLDKLLLSILSAVALSLVLIVNHKKGRYAGY